MSEPTKLPLVEAIEVLIGAASARAESKRYRVAPGVHEYVARVDAALSAFEGWGTPITEEWLHEHTECITTSPPKFPFSTECGTVYVSNERRMGSRGDSCRWRVDACGGELDLTIRTRGDLLLLLAGLHAEGSLWLPLT